MFVACSVQRVTPDDVARMRPAPGRACTPVGSRCAERRYAP